METPCRKEATRFFNAKIVLYQCTSIDIIQSKAERENVIAKMKINIFENSSRLENKTMMVSGPARSSFREFFLNNRVKKIHRIKKTIILRKKNGTFRNTDLCCNIGSSGTASL
jgi:hypothetical protein